MKRIAIKFAAVRILGFFLLLAACASTGKTIDVTVAVDFGPANRAKLQKTVAVPESSTVLDALKSAYPIVTSGR
jgi:hypothetical protein